MSDDNPAAPQGPLPSMGVPEEITRAVLDAVAQVWRRPAMSHRERSLITISTLVALGRVEPLRVHIKSGLANGITPDEIYETILHVGFYAGFGAAVDAFSTAASALADDR